MKAIGLTIIILIGSALDVKSGELNFSKHLDSSWKKSIMEYAEKHLQHTAWGVAHSKRCYLMSLKIAGMEKLHVDKDVLFAAAFLHDLGAFSEFAKKGVEHSQRSADLVDDILIRNGFPAEKIELVKETILGHMFYSEVGESNESIVMHDADTLDFLGTLGIARLISVTTRHRFADDLPSAIETIQKFHNDLPAKLITDYAKKIAKTRADDTELFINALKRDAGEINQL